MSYVCTFLKKKNNMSRLYNLHVILAKRLRTESLQGPDGDRRRWISEFEASLVYIVETTRYLKRSKQEAKDIYKHSSNPITKEA